MKTVELIGYWLVIIGGLNWGIVGLGWLMNDNWNAVHSIIGQWPQLEGIVYVLVGASALWMLAMTKGKPKM